MVHLSLLVCVLTLCTVQTTLSLRTLHFTRIAGDLLQALSHRHDNKWYGLWWTCWWHWMEQVCNIMQRECELSKQMEQSWHEPSLFKSLIYMHKDCTTSLPLVSMVLPSLICYLAEDYISELGLHKDTGNLLATKSKGCLKVSEDKQPPCQQITLDQQIINVDRLIQCWLYFYSTVSTWWACPRMPSICIITENTNECRYMLYFVWYLVV